MREGLPAMLFCRFHDFLHLVDGALRRRCHLAGLEVDDAADEWLDAVGALLDPRRDARSRRGVILQRLAHERAIAALVMDGGARAIDVGGVGELAVKSL